MYSSQSGVMNKAQVQSKYNLGIRLLSVEHHILIHFLLVFTFFSQLEACDVSRQRIFRLKRDLTLKNISVINTEYFECLKNSY